MILHRLLQLNDVLLDLPLKINPSQYLGIVVLHLTLSQYNTPVESLLRSNCILLDLEFNILFIYLLSNGHYLSLYLAVFIIRGLFLLLFFYFDDWLNLWNAIHVECLVQQLSPFDGLILGEFFHHISQLLLLLQNDPHELSLLLFVNSGNLLLRLLDLLLQLTLDQLLLHSRQLVTVLHLPKLILLLLILLNLCSRLRLLLNLCQLEDHVLSSLVLALRLHLDLLPPLFLLYSRVLPYPFDGLLE